jgi:Ca-activated chloride channel family protein
LLAGCLAPSGACAKNPGVEAYEREDYKGAAEVFTKQLERMPGSEALHFNKGATAYKQRDYALALEAFSKAVTTRDPRLRAAAEYNLGNTLYQRGAAIKDKEPKVKEWKNALQHYDQALNVQPGNKDAKYNRDLVQRLIDELEKKDPPKSEDKKPDQKKNENKDNPDKQQPKTGDNKNEQKENPQDQQKQEEKSQGKEPQPQNQDNPGNEKSDEPDKGEKKDGQQGDSKDQKGDKGEPKDDKKNGEKDPDPQGEAKKGDKGGHPKPDPNEPDRKLAGDIKPQNGQPQPPTAEQQEAADAQAAAEGKMTEAQARGLLDSLKGEDSRVQLLKPGEKRAGSRVIKDW